MKIQIISFNAKNFERFECSSFGCPNTFDSFDVNIIDLTDQGIWKSNSSRCDTMAKPKDIRTLSDMMENSFKSKILIVLPQNIEYTYGDLHKEKMKDILGSISRIIGREFFNNEQCPSIHYEYNTTKLCDIDCKSDFYFKDIASGYSFNTITKSINSEKPTTISLGEQLILTSLDILEDENIIEKFFKEIGLWDENIIDFPEWLLKYEFFDDKDRIEEIKKSKSIIEEEKEIIENARIRLEKNNYFKSILVTNGDKLVYSVFEILQEILKTDLSEFVDKKDEDFLTILENVTFIGEIKGISTNVKSENVSQLDVHYQKYLDKLEEEKAGKAEKEKVKALLIINPFRNKPVEERETINDEQIELAKRNGSLIISTEVLLKIYERFLKNELKSEDIINVFTTKIGLLEMIDFDNV